MNKTRAGKSCGSSVSSHKVQLHKWQLVAKEQCIFFEWLFGDNFNVAVSEEMYGARGNRGRGVFLLFLLQDSSLASMNYLWTKLPFLL